MCMCATNHILSHKRRNVVKRRSISNDPIHRDSVVGNIFFSLFSSFCLLKFMKLSLKFGTILKFKEKNKYISNIDF